MTTFPCDTDVKFTFELLSEALCLAEVEDFFKMEAEDMFASSLYKRLWGFNSFFSCFWHISITEVEEGGLLVLVVLLWFPVLRGSSVLQFLFCTSCLGSAETKLGPTRGLFNLDWLLWEDLSSNPPLDFVSVLWGTAPALSFEYPLSTMSLPVTVLSFPET